MGGLKFKGAQNLNKNKRQSPDDDGSDEKDDHDNDDAKKTNNKSKMKNHGHPRSNLRPRACTVEAGLDRRDASLWSSYGASDVTNKDDDDENDDAEIGGRLERQIGSVRISRVQMRILEACFLSQALKILCAALLIQIFCLSLHHTFE